MARPFHYDPAKTAQPGPEPQSANQSGITRGSIQQAAFERNALDEGKDRLPHAEA